MTVKENNNTNVDAPVVIGLTTEIVDECFNEANDKLHDAVLAYEDKGLHTSKEVKLRVGKLLAIARAANKETSEALPSNFVKSRTRLKELLHKLVNDEGVVSISLIRYSSGKTPVVMTVTGDGERSVEQLSKRIFHNALVHGECLSTIELSVRNGSIRTIELELNCSSYMYKGLTLKSAELGFISHTMYDIDNLANHYGVHLAKSPFEDEVRYLRGLCITLNAKVANDTSVKYYSIDSKDDNCLIERLIGLSD